MPRDEFLYWSQRNNLPTIHQQLCNVKLKIYISDVVIRQATQTTTYLQFAQSSLHAQYYETRVNIWRSIFRSYAFAVLLSIRANNWCLCVCVRAKRVKNSHQWIGNFARRFINSRYSDARIDINDNISFFALCFCRTLCEVIILPAYIRKIMCLDKLRSWLLEQMSSRWR